MSQLWERTPIAEEALSVVVLEAGDAALLGQTLSELKSVLGHRQAEILVPVTPRQVESLQSVIAGNQSARLVPHEDVALGVGSALKVGLEAARHPLLLTLPVGYSAKPLPQFLKEIDQVDIVAGVRQAKVKGWKWRQFFSKAYQLFGLWMQDPECGMKLYRRELFERLPLQSKGAFVQIEILSKANFESRLLTEVIIEGPESEPAIVNSDFWKVLNNPDFGKPPAKVDMEKPIKPIIVSQAPEARP
ncbi:MAG: hypothetical protein U0796_23330 [Gemmatales bacterium]